MKIYVKYFASLRELMGEADVRLEIDENTSVNEVWKLVTASKNVQFDHVMMAVNREYVKPDCLLKAGDEIAFFPPVTGG